MDERPHPLKDGSNINAGKRGRDGIGRRRCLGRVPLGAIVRRIASGKHILLADISEKNLESAAQTLSQAGFEVKYSIY